MFGPQGDVEAASGDAHRGARPCARWRKPRYWAPWSAPASV